MRLFNLYDDDTWDHIGTAQVEDAHAQAFADAAGDLGFLIEEVTA